MEKMELEETVEALSITDENELINADSLMHYVKTCEKKIGKKYDDEIKKYDKLHKEALAKKKAELKAYEDAEKLIKKAVVHYDDMCDAYNDFLTPTPYKELGLKSISIVKTKKARVVDEDKVPDKFGELVIRKPDGRLLNAIAKDFGDVEIPGVEFYFEKSVRAK